VTNYIYHPYLVTYDAFSPLVQFRPARK